MRHLNDLDLEDPKVKEWMDEHFKAGEYAVLSIMVAAGTDAEARLVEHLKGANLNMVVIPGPIVQVMINFKEINKLVESLRGSGFNLEIPARVQAKIDFADDGKKGTVQ